MTSNDVPAIERLPAPDPWSPTVLFETVRIAMSHYSTRQATRAWTAQVLVEQMHRVSRERGRGVIDTGEANRLTLTLLQHLELVYRFRGGIFSSKPPLVLRELDLSQQVFTNLNLRNVTFHSCKLDGSDLSHARFSECTFTACSFEGTDLERARLSRCAFRGCSFRQASLVEAAFIQCRLLGCNLDEAATDGTRGLPQI
jgi:hypothetical protein